MPKTQKELQDELNAVNRVLKEMQTESDRAVAVLVGAEVDNRLLALLEAFLFPPQKKSTRLLEQDGPLGTFSSKIEILYRVGLIPPEFHHDLHTIRAIRNEFAHKGVGLSFNSDRVRDLCRNLIAAESMRQDMFSKSEDMRAKNAMDSARDRFMNSAMMLLANLTLLRFQVCTSPQHWRGFFRDRKQPEQ
jgi:DNA-binding MltR family transcriptional regulator